MANQRIAVLIGGQLRFRDLAHVEDFNCQVGQAALFVCTDKFCAPLLPMLRGARASTLVTSAQVNAHVEQVKAARPGLYPLLYVQAIGLFKLKLAWELMASHEDQATYTHVVVVRTDSFGWSLSKIAEHLQRVDGSTSVLHAWDHVFAASREHMDILCSFSDHYAASLSEIASRPLHLYPEAHMFRFLVERHGLRCVLLEQDVRLYAHRAEFRLMWGEDDSQTFQPQGKNLFTHYHILANFLSHPLTLPLYYLIVVVELLAFCAAVLCSSIARRLCGSARAARRADDDDEADADCTLSTQAQFWSGVLLRHPARSKGLWHPSKSQERSQAMKEQRRVWSMLWGKLYGS